jgi:hypothetical protein
MAIEALRSVRSGKFSLLHLYHLRNLGSELTLGVVEGSEFVFLVVSIDRLLPSFHDAGDDLLIAMGELFENRERDQPFIFFGGSDRRRRTCGERVVVVEYGIDRAVNESLVRGTTGRGTALAVRVSRRGKGKGSVGSVGCSGIIRRDSLSRDRSLPLAFRPGRGEGMNELEDSAGELVDRSLLGYKHLFQAHRSPGFRLRFSRDGFGRIDRQFRVLRFFQGIGSVGSRLGLDIVRGVKFGNALSVVGSGGSVGIGRKLSLDPLSERVGVIDAERAGGRRRRAFGERTGDPGPLESFAIGRLHPTFRS